MRQVSRNFPIVDCPVLFAINSFCASYGHFVLTTLPIVLSFLDEIARHDLKVVIPADAPAWMTSILDELGVTEIMLLRLANRPCYFRTAIVSNILDASNTRAPNPACLTWSRALFGKQFPSLRKGRRIFVRRSAVGNLSSRILANESEIIEALRSNGFDIVEPAAMTFSSQVEAFRGADVVVSPHGSTLANLIFCRPGTRVLDLMPDDWVGIRGDSLRDVWAARLCAAVGLDYSALLSPSKILSIHKTGNPEIVSRVSTEALASSILTS